MNEGSFMFKILVFSHFIFLIGSSLVVQSFKASLPGETKARTFLKIKKQCIKQSILGSPKCEFLFDFSLKESLVDVNPVWMDGSILRL